MTPVTFLKIAVFYRPADDGGRPEVMDGLEFIARVTSHIPDKSQAMVRYNGLYAKGYGGKARQANLATVSLRLYGLEGLGLCRKRASHKPGAVGEKISDLACLIKEGEINVRIGLPG